MALSMSRFRVSASSPSLSRGKTTVATSSIVDAKARVREHARSISRSTAKAATSPAPTV